MIPTVFKILLHFCVALFFLECVLAAAGGEGEGKMAGIVVGSCILLIYSSYFLYKWIRKKYENSKYYTPKPSKLTLIEEEMREKAKELKKYKEDSNSEASANR